MAIKPEQPSGSIDPFALATAVTLQPEVGPSPPTIPDYDLLRRIGGGAYGEIWLAQSKATAVVRAVKIVRRRSFDDERPFEREFEGIKSFERISRQHPSQLAIFHIGRNETEGYFYYVMEPADGLNGGSPKEKNIKDPLASHSGVLSYVPHTLGEELRRRGRLPAERCVEIGRALASALGHLHKNGLVHRDVKPSNVIFVGGMPKLADIGLVTEAGDTRSIVGTEGYLPPEGPGTPQADIFSLGKVLYEISTGQKRRHFPDLPCEVRQWPDREVILELNEIILKACANDARGRYTTAEQMEAELGRVRAGQSVRRMRQLTGLGRLLWRGSRWVFLGLIAAALVVLVGRAYIGPKTQHLQMRSSNEKANRAFDLGRVYLDRLQGTNFQLAADCFSQATREDPKFAPSWGYLAWTYAWSDGEWNQGWQLLPKAKRIALQALQLDPAQPEAHLALGWYYSFQEFAWQDADIHYKLAVKKSPSSAPAHTAYAESLRMRGQVDQALEEIKKAKDIEPLSLKINIRLADVFFAARQHQLALEQCDYAMTMDQGVKPKLYMYEFRAKILGALGKYAEAIDTEQRLLLAAGQSSQQVEQELVSLKRAVIMDGPSAYWGWKLRQHAEAPGEMYFRGRAYAQLGERDKALDALKLAFKDREQWFIFYMATDWALDPVRGDARFEDLCRAMHLK